MTELLNYDTSWLNPTLKVIMVLLFVFVAYVYFQSPFAFAGDVTAVLLLLFWMAVAGAITAAVRYFGHGELFGFNKEFSLKWFQSVGYLVQSILLLMAARKLAKGVLPRARA